MDALTVIIAELRALVIVHVRVAVSSSLLFPPCCCSCCCCCYWAKVTTVGLQVGITLVGAVNVTVVVSEKN